MLPGWKRGLKVSYMHTLSKLIRPWRYGGLSKSYQEGCMWGIKGDVQVIMNISGYKTTLGEKKRQRKLIYSASETCSGVPGRGA